RRRHLSDLRSFPTRRSSDLAQFVVDLGGPHEELYFAYRVRFQQGFAFNMGGKLPGFSGGSRPSGCDPDEGGFSARNMWRNGNGRSEEHTSELQSRENLVCRL